MLFDFRGEEVVENSVNGRTETFNVGDFDFFTNGWGRCFKWKSIYLYVELRDPRQLNSNNSTRTIQLRVNSTPNAESHAKSHANS